MTYTPKTPFGILAAEKLEPWLSDDLARYIDSLGIMFDPVLEISAESGAEGEPGWVPAWSKLLNVTTCPDAYLRYLAMFVGVQVKKTSEESMARAEVEKEVGFRRGTLEAVEEAIHKVFEGPPTFPASPPVLDSFGRAFEEPLLNGGKWTGAGKIPNPGRVGIGEAWEPGPSGSANAFWVEKEYRYPAISLELTNTASPSAWLYCNLEEPDEANGYKIEFGFGEKVTIVERKGGKGTSLASVTGVKLESGDHIGLTKRPGVLRAWHKHNGVWINVLSTEIEDSVFPKGYVGFGANPSGASEYRNFAVEATSGSEVFVIQERTARSGAADPYHFNVIVAPGKASEELEEAIRAVKPGGVFFSVIEVENAWINAEKKWSEVTAGKKFSGIKEGEY